jgi:hypothetical protein
MFEKHIRFATIDHRSKFDFSNFLNSSPTNRVRVKQSCKHTCLYHSAGSGALFLGPAHFGLKVKLLKTLKQKSQKRLKKRKTSCIKVS